jgi:hypothetical protein
MTIPCAIDAPLRRMRRRFGTGAGLGGASNVCSTASLSMRDGLLRVTSVGAPVLMPIFHPGARGRCHLLGYGVVIVGTAFEILVRGGPLRSLANRCERHALVRAKTPRFAASASICRFVPGDAGYVGPDADDEGIDDRCLVPSATRSLATDHLARCGANDVDAFVAMRCGAPPHGAASRYQRSLRR